MISILIFENLSSLRSWKFIAQIFHFETRPVKTACCIVGLAFGCCTLQMNEWMKIYFSLKLYCESEKPKTSTKNIGELWNLLKSILVDPDHRSRSWLLNAVSGTINRKGISLGLVWQLIVLLVLSLIFVHSNM